MGYNIWCVAWCTDDSLFDNAISTDKMRTCKHPTGIVVGLILSLLFWATVVMLFLALQ